MHLAIGNSSILRVCTFLVANKVPPQSASDSEYWFKLKFELIKFNSFQPTFNFFTVLTTKTTRAIAWCTIIWICVTAIWTWIFSICAFICEQKINFAFINLPITSLNHYLNLNNRQYLFALYPKRTCPSVVQSHFGIIDLLYLSLDNHHQLKRPAFVE